MGDFFINGGTLTGSYSWTNAAIWQSGLLPTTGDNVYLIAAQEGFSIDSGLNQGTMLLASLTCYSTFQGDFGGLGTNTANIPASVTNVGVPAPDGSSGTGPNTWKHNNGTNAGVWNIYASAASNSDSPQTPITISGSNAGNVINMIAGGVAGLGVLYPNEAASFPTIRANGGTLYIGSGVLTSTIQNNGGTLTVAAGGWSGTNAGGSLITRGTFSINALTCIDGTINLNNRAASGSSIGTLNLYGATADFSGNPAPVMIGNTVLRAGSIKQFLPNQVTLGTISVDTNGNETFTVENG